ncbi:MAG: hemerythrin domain-containing protein [Deltaproteobacteria bacterium]
MARTAVRNRVAARTARRHAGILQVLKEEHDRVKKLFGKALGHPETSEEVFASIYSDLEAHMRGEEQFFYPELEPSEDVRELVLEAYEEHNMAKILLNELESMSSGDERWMAKIKVLDEIIEHHIQEEEGRIFPRARKILGKEREAQIAQQYLEEKPELEEEPQAGAGEEELEEF